MNALEAPTSVDSRPQRVVSLPCGHEVRVAHDASLIAVSGPVLDHQSRCPGRGPSSFAAWFVPVSFSRRDLVPHPGWSMDSGPQVPPIASP
jgi:hypothetical protein